MRQVRLSFRLNPVLVTLLSAAVLPSLLLAAPTGGQVRAGDARIAQNGTRTSIDQRSDRAVIDWRSFGISATESVEFRQPGVHSATLNRVTGDQLSAIHGRIQANGQVLLVNPNGVVIGQGARIDVGGLIVSTADLGNDDFMANRLVFDKPGRPGAAIHNSGQINVAQGGLAALVAPHVRNDGIIAARLGKVALGAGETWTLDLQGDGLLKIGIAADQAALLAPRTGGGAALEHSGAIHADGGQVVLVAAATARQALDQVINLNGTVRADTIDHRDGRIVLRAADGATQVSGQLRARGESVVERGGTVQVLGARVSLATHARIDVSGSDGGGLVQIGGGRQGSGELPRAQNTSIAAGAMVIADAHGRGNGGEVVVWADGKTAYAGRISARGGRDGGDGGRVEVSGRNQLQFQGAVDAGAARGAQGSLLLDPMVFNVGSSEAALISSVLRTGTSTSIAADQDVNVGATIDGRGGLRGGGLTIRAGRDINVNDAIHTADGAVSLQAGNTVNTAPTAGIFAGNAPIELRTGGNLSTGAFVTRGRLNLVSTGGDISLNAPVGTTNGRLDVRATGNVRINQPLRNLVSGAGLSVSAGRDLEVNASVDGRGGVAGGSVELSAGRALSLNDSVTTNNGAINTRATPYQVRPGEGLYAGAAPIDVTGPGAVRDLVLIAPVATAPALDPVVVLPVAETPRLRLPVQDRVVNAAGSLTPAGLGGLAITVPTGPQVPLILVTPGPAASPQGPGTGMANPLAGSSAPGRSSGNTSWVRPVPGPSTSAGVAARPAPPVPGPHQGVDGSDGPSAQPATLPEVAVVGTDLIDPHASALEGSSDETGQRSNPIASGRRADGGAGTEGDSKTGEDSRTGGSAGSLVVANAPPSEILLFSGGRGIAQAADLGRAGAFGSASEAYREELVDLVDERRRRGSDR